MEFCNFWIRASDGMEYGEKLNSHTDGSRYPDKQQNGQENYPYVYRRSNDGTFILKMENHNL